MNIILKPDAVNFSGNLKRFKISTTSSISFILKQGSRTLFEASYTPGSNQMVEIDVKDIIEADLNVQFRNLSYPYEQPDMAKTYTAYVDEQSVEFTVVKGGVDNLATADVNFMQFNWLTWQPQIKKVTYYLPEMLTFFSAVESVVKVKAYFKEDNGSYSEETKQLLSIIAGKAYTIPVQYAVIAGEFDSRMPAFYDVWFENTEGVRLSYIQRYVASETMSEDEQWIIFENSLGGFDTFRAYGTNTLSANHEHQLAEMDEETNEYRVDTSREYTKNTGYLSGYERKWMLDFFPSKQKYLYDGNSLRKIIVTEDSTSYVSNQLPTSYEFTYKYADAKPYLNLKRPEELPTDLDIQVPDLGSFTIPPRLVEFPSQNLTEGVLFPVQNPYSENWATTTIGAILNYVLKNIIELGQDGSGGIGHTHPNLELLNALEWLEGYLIAYGQKIKAGYADVADDLTEKARELFLKKYKDDSTNYLLSLLGGANVWKNLTLGEFITGVSGGLLTEKGEMEMESGYFRKRLFVPEIAYNRITYFKGRAVLSPGGGCKIKSYVKNEDGSFTVTPDLTDADALSQFADDILSAFFTTKNADGKLTGFAQMQFRVTEADYNTKTFKMVNRPGQSYEPGEEMILAQTGNFTDEDRQTYILFDTINGNNCITFFDHANTWDPEPAQMPSWFGKKKGMTVQGINADNYSAVLQNIIMTGLIFQIDEITGESVRVPLWKGEWVKGKYGYFNEVSHNGSRYICVNPKGTEQEPGTGVDWLVTVKKGEDGAPGLSVVGGGHWEASKTPYAANTMVTLANCVFLSNVETSNPPIRISRFKSGNYRRMKNGGYILAGKSVDWEINPDWTMLLDGRELKGTSITFLGSFSTAPSNPAEGNSYYNTTDKCTYVYQGGMWMLMVSDGKDGRDYEYIYYRNNSIGIIPDKPDSQQQDDYVPEGWTADYLGVSEEYQVEWGCKRTKKDGVWSEWSTPAVVHRWSKDGESNILADLDNEMVSCALTFDGKTKKSESWTTNIGLWYGTERLDLDSISYAENGVFSVSANKETGAVTVSVQANASVPDTTNIRLTLTASKSGQIYSRDLVFTIAGVRAGANGVGVLSVTNYYLAINQSDGVTNSTSGWTETVQQVSAQKRYLWNYEKITYTDGLSVNTKPAIIGMYSSDGEPGSDGKGINSVTEEYGVSTSQSTQPTIWQSTIPVMSALNKYLWNRETTIYTDSSKKTITHVIAVYGDKGDDAILYSLVPSASSIIKYKDGTYNVPSVSCTRQKIVGSTISETTDGELKYSLDGGAEQNASNGQAISSGLITKSIKFLLYVGGKLVDVETIPLITDGTNGTDGTSMNPRGNWVSSGVPYYKNDLVNFAYGTFVALRQTNNPPYPISRFKNGSYRRKKDGGYILAGNGTTLNEDWQVVTPPTYPGSYWLDCPVSSIGISSVGTPSPSSVLVTCKMNIRNSVQLCSDFYLVARKYNASWIAHVSPVKSFELSVPATAGYTQFAVRAYRSSSDANSWNDNYVCEKGIGVVTDGQNGNDGKDSAFPYDNGPWQSGNTYVWNDTRRDKVIHPFNGVYYNFLVKNKGASVTVAPSSANGDSNWEAMNKLINIATDSLFADGANVANFLFKNGVLRSQDETDGVANIIMNGKTGYFHCSNADITGTINAKSGTFAGKLVGATGTFTGSLLTNSSGKRILINPDTRSIQLILPDNNVISEWAFFELNGYSSCTLKLFNNGGENLILYPHIMQIRRGSNVQLNAEPDALTLVNGSNSISIRANQITMSDGNNYTGYTGTAEYVPPNGYSKTLYFKNGILYKIG